MLPEEERYAPPVLSGMGMGMGEDSEVSETDKRMKKKKRKLYWYVLNGAGVSN